jgi:hypothetical protein
MNLKKSLLVGILIGAMVFAVAGCAKTEQPPPVASDAIENQNPMPPEGDPPPGERPPAPELDLAAAAAKLGVTEEQLQDALGNQWPLDLAAAAEKLGVSEESFREALGIPERPAFPGGGPPQGGPAPAGEPQ